MALKVSQYKIHDAAGVAAEPDQFVNKEIVFANGVTPDFDSNWSGIPLNDVAKVTSIPAVAAAVAYTQDVTFATNATKGEQFVITFRIPARGPIARRLARPQQ